MTKALMAKAEAAGQPGEAHKALAPLEGNWTVEVQIWPGPDAEPITSRGTANARFILDGRFIRENFKGEFMGKPYQGFLFIGYDNMTGVYNHVWMDSSNTTMSISTGTASDDWKTFTFTGVSPCPMTGDKEVPFKQVLNIQDDGKRVMKIYQTRDGEEVKVMKITYTPAPAES